MQYRPYDQRRINECSVCGRDFEPTGEYTYEAECDECYSEMREKEAEGYEEE